jgi:LDH2 family malate/lactate/ureidoglycolate dehydrogenase
MTPGGAIRPSGGYKGTGLALVAEALAGILTASGSVTAEPASDAQGVFCVAIDIARLRPLDEFTAELDRALAYVRDVPLEAGHDAVRFPGESGAAAEVERRRDGVPVQPFTWQRLEELAGEFGVPLPDRLS